MRIRIRRKTARSDSGQSLVEIALMLPILLILVLNAINFGYFLYVVLNLSTAPRSAVEYSIIGSSAPGGTGLPPAAGTGTNTASTLTYLDMLGALNASTGISVQVCSKALGTSGSGTAQISKCETCSSSTSCSSTPGAGTPAPDSDPEASTFVLNRVDVQYTFRLLIPGTPFGAVLLPSSACSASGGNVNCTINRHVSMRAMD
jgi:Flp pilus assembly protein TadG